MEVNFLGFLECVVIPGNPCIGDLVFTKLMTREEFLQSIANFSEFEQRRELAVYNIYESHIVASYEYGVGKTPKDMSCSSGFCGDDDKCTDAPNLVLTRMNQNQNETNARIQSQTTENTNTVQDKLGNPSTAANGTSNTMLGIGIALAVVVLLIILSGLVYLFYSYKINNTINSPLGFNLL